MWLHNDEFADLARRFQQAELPPEKRRLRGELAHMVLRGQVKIDPAFDQNLRNVQDRVQQTVCPIYEEDDRERPALFGSGVILRVPPRLFLLTAAHVLDRNRQSTLYVPGRDELVPLKGSSGRTLEPASGRIDDKIDIGFVCLEAAMQEELTRFRILRPEDIDANDAPAPKTLYAFAGYPATQNNPMPERRLQLNTTIYSVLPRPGSDYAALKLHPAAHFLGNLTAGD